MRYASCAFLIAPLGMKGVHTDKVEQCAAKLLTHAVKVLSEKTC